MNTTGHGHDANVREREVMPTKHALMNAEGLGEAWKTFKPMGNQLHGGPGRSRRLYICNLTRDHDEQARALSISSAYGL